MPRPIAEIIADKYVEESHGLLRVQEHLFRRVDVVISNLHRDLARLVKLVDPASGNTAARLRVLERRSKKLIEKAYREAAQITERELQDVAKLEAEHTRVVLRQAFELALEEEL
jgi:hypothetical protein